MKLFEQTLKDILGALIASENSRSLIFNCPECFSEKFYIDKRSGASYCFKCSKGYSTEGAISILTKMSREEARLKLNQENSADFVEKLSLDFASQNRSAISDDDFASTELLPEIQLDPTFIDVDQVEEAKQYLISRGVTDPAIWKHFKLKYHPLMKGIVFPVYMNGRLVGWQCRMFVPDQNGLRMRSSPGLQKAKILLNYDEAIKQPNIVLGEGPFDCVKANLTQHGFGAVASFGKGVSKTQVQLLLESPSENIFLGLDKDAYLEVEQLCRDLCRVKKVFRVLPPDHRKDLGECNEEEMLAALMAAEPCFEHQTARLELFMR